MLNNLIVDKKNYSMKLAFNFLLLIFTFFIMGNKSISLSEYQIKKICKKEKRELSCIKNLQEKKFDLQKGNLIEIPVIPHKK